MPFLLTKLIPVSLALTFGLISNCVWAVDITINSPLTVTISANGTSAVGSENNASIVNLNNTSTISVTTSGEQSAATGIINNGTIVNLSNGGSISGEALGFTDVAGDGIDNYGTINYLSNSGQISGRADNDFSAGIYNFGTIVNLTNEASGTVSSVGNAFFESGRGVDNRNIIITLINNGAISGNFYGIQNFDQTGTGNIDTLTNGGTISGGDIGIYNDHNNIDTLTNSGTISGGRIGISNLNGGTIGILNNSQGVGNAQGALTYQGSLPTHYNIIINSPSDFGKLLAVGGVSGTTSFGISSLSAGSSIVSGTAYAAVLNGITNTQLGITGTSQAGTSNGYTYLLSTSGSDIWDLIISAFAQGPSVADTQASIQTLAGKLRSIFNASSITSNFANMNTYDCNLFDAKGMCISAGGRFTTVDNPNSNSTSAVVVVGYKATPNIRIGGFLDQNVNNNTPSGVHISNKNPLMGAFVVWNQNTDGLGYQVKLANAYQDKNVDTTREVIGTSEAGKGSTDLTTQSYVGELSYAFNYNDKTLLRPYLALRHTTIKQDAYTETGVATPLSYDSLEDRSTTALLGLKLNHQLTPKTTLTASLGIEQDLEHSVDQYSASSTGISGLTSENFNDSIKRTRPVASAGAYYAVSKTQRIAGDIYYQQLPFQSTGSTTAYFNYTVGF